MPQKKLVDFIMANTCTSLREDAHRGQRKRDDSGQLIALYHPRRQNQYGVVKEIPKHQWSHRMKPLGSTYQGKGETMRGTAARHPGQNVKIDDILDPTEIPVWPF